MTPATPKRRPGRPPGPDGPGVEIRCRISPRAAADLKAWAEARGLAAATRRKQLEALIRAARLGPCASPSSPS